MRFKLAKKYDLVRSVKLVHNIEMRLVPIVSQKVTLFIFE